MKGKHSILVVDDEPAICNMLSMLLIGHGYAVDCAESAAAAIQRLKKGRVDLVILDVILPDGDGVHLAKLIKEMDPALPILLFSGLEQDAQLQTQAKQVGAIAYVRKTAPSSQLIATVRKVLPDPQRLTDGFTQILHKQKGEGPDPSSNQ